MVSNLLIVLKLHLPMVGMLWYIALVQSEEQSMSCNHHSKLCYSVCSHHELGERFVIPGSVFEAVLATKVCHPLKHKCHGARKVEYIIHDEDGLKIVTMLLLLSGDVETNPGPGIYNDRQGQIQTHRGFDTELGESHPNTFKVSRQFGW